MLNGDGETGGSEFVQIFFLPVYMNNELGINRRD